MSKSIEPTLYDLRLEKKRVESEINIIKGLARTTRFQSLQAKESNDKTVSELEEKLKGIEEKIEKKKNSKSLSLKTPVSFEIHLTPKSGKNTDSNMAFMTRTPTTKANDNYEIPVTTDFNRGTFVHFEEPIPPQRTLPIPTISEENVINTSTGTKPKNLRAPIPTPKVTTTIYSAPTQTRSVPSNKFSTNQIFSTSISSTKPTFAQSTPNKSLHFFDDIPDEYLNMNPISSSKPFVPERKQAPQASSRFNRDELEEIIKLIRKEQSQTIEAHERSHMNQKKVPDFKGQDHNYEDNQFEENQFENRHFENHQFENRQFGNKRFDNDYNQFDERQFGDQNFNNENRRFGNCQFEDRNFENHQFENRQFTNENRRFDFDNRNFENRYNRHNDQGTRNPRRYAFENEDRNHRKSEDRHFENDNRDFNDQRPKNFSVYRDPENSRFDNRSATFDIPNDELHSRTRSRLRFETEIPRSTTRNAFLKRLQLIPAFEGESYEKLKTFLNMTETLYKSCINQQEEIEFFDTFRLQLRGEAFKFVANLDNNDISFYTIKEKLLEHFAYLSNKCIVSSQLQNMRQETNEPLNKYVERARKLLKEKNALYENASKDLLENHNETACHAFIRGLGNFRLKDRLLTRGAKTLEDAISYVIEAENFTLSQIPQNELFCRYCKSEGHRERDCRRKTSNQDNQLSNLFRKLLVEPNNNNGALQRNNFNSGQNRNWNNNSNNNRNWNNNTNWNNNGNSNTNGNWNNNNNQFRQNPNNNTNNRFQSNNNQPNQNTNTLRNQNNNNNNNNDYQNNPQRSNTWNQNNNRNTFFVEDCEEEEELFEQSPTDSGN